MCGNIKVRRISVFVQCRFFFLQNKVIAFKGTAFLLALRLLFAVHMLNLIKHIMQERLKQIKKNYLLVSKMAKGF